MVMRMRIMLWSNSLSKTTHGKRNSGKVITIITSSQKSLQSNLTTKRNSSLQRSKSEKRKKPNKRWFRLNNKHRKKHLEVSNSSSRHRRGE